jgi:hypothetical protein
VNAAPSRPAELKGSAAADQRVEPARDPGGEPLHAAGEPLRIAGLDDQVQMIPLHRKVNEAKAVALLRGGKGAPDGAEGAAAAQVPDMGQDAHRDVRGVMRRQGGAALVRDARAGTGGLATCAFALAAPGAEVESELPCASHLESAL